jgi:hypothetical protein
MAIQIPRVQPGDLITAGFVNGLIDQLIALDGRVSDLERVLPGHGAIQIFSPLSSDTYHIGSELRVVGQGFGIPALNTVLFDGISRVSTFKAGSNDNLLILDIPTFVIPSQGKVVTMSVSNATGFAQVNFTLLPPVVTVPTGQLFFAQTSTAAQTVKDPGFDLFYTVSAAVTMADTYTFVPQLSSAVPGWEAFLVDAQNNRISPDFQIGAQSSTPIHVRVVVPAGLANGTKVGLTINLVSKNHPTTVRSATTGIIELTVGSLVPGVERIGVTRGKVTDNQGTTLQPDAQGVYTLPIARAPASFFYTITAPPGASPANYTATATLDANAVGWPAQPAMVVDPPGGKLPSFAGQKQLQANVTPQSGAQPASVTVKVSADVDPTNTIGHLTLPIRAG